MRQIFFLFLSLAILAGCKEQEVRPPIPDAGTEVEIPEADVRHQLVWDRADAPTPTIDEDVPPEPPDVPEVPKSKVDAGVADAVPAEDSPDATSVEIGGPSPQEVPPLPDGWETMVVPMGPGVPADAGPGPQ